MEFMRDGGSSMWLMVFAAVTSVVVAFARKPEERAVTLLAGCVVSVIFAVLGMSLGMQAVAAQYTRFPEPLAAVAQGLRELSNNGLLGAMLATLQGMGALIVRSRAHAS